MTIGSHELALTIINDGAGYPRRCAIARLARNAVSQLSTAYTASSWLDIVHAGVRKYEADFGTRGACCFTTEDILLAAVELDEYYAQHIRECDEATAA